MHKLLPIAQCPVPGPDEEYCYNNDETDVVAFELCPDPGETIIAEICQGSFEACCDNLTVYEGTPGSGTGGTILFGPAAVGLEGTILTSGTIDNCLIFVTNSDGSFSCSDDPQFVPLKVYVDECPSAPVADFNYCYTDDENDVVRYEICPNMPSERVASEICFGTFESGKDSLKVFEGAQGSGTSGDTLRFLTGDLTAVYLETTTAGNCLIFAVFSDFSNSCVSGNQSELAINQVSLLPAELISFEGERYERSAMLEWVTVTEQNTEWFVVERSETGTSKWSEIGRVEAAGTSQDKQEYTLEDLEPLQLAYYRLKTLDQDGHVEYSRIIKLETVISDDLQVQIFPNPSDGLFTLRTSSMQDKEQEIDISIYNVQGQLVHNRSISVTGIDQNEIDLREEDKGLYFMSIRSGKQSRVEQIVIF